MDKPGSIALRRQTACIAAWLFAGIASTGVAHAEQFGSITFEPCVLTSPGLPRPAEARCATIPVPENPADPEGRWIDLALAWIPVDGRGEPDPVFFIAGGPGQSARDSYPGVAPALADIGRNRHLLLLDQRGTGGSNLLACQSPEWMDSVPGALELDAARAREEAERCRVELELRADLRFYTTTEAVHDLEYVRQRLGVARINLIGVSYGTRVAQQYAKTHPDQVRTLLLDSVVPMDVSLGSEHTANLIAALEAQFDRCRSTPACVEAFGDPEDRLDDVAGMLNTGNPGAVFYRDPTSGEWREEVPTFEHVLGVLRMYAYTPLTASLLPLIVHQAFQFDYAAILAMARLLVRDLDVQIASGMHNSVICSEDADDLEPPPALEDALFDDRMVALLKAQCSAWPRGARPADFRAPLAGEIPTLLVSGEHDPVTPPRYGDRVAASLRHVRHLVLKGQGHSLLSTGCMPKLAAQFVERADALGLDAACLDRVAAPPPFSGMHGWEP